MTHAHPVPDVHARGRLAVENMTGSAVALVGACQRADQIQLCAGIDDPAYAAQNAIHLSKCSEAIDVHGYEARSLHEKFFVCHADPQQEAMGNPDTHSEVATLQNRDSAKNLFGAST